MINLAIFSSHNGSNFQNIVESFRDNKVKISPALLVCNNEESYVLNRAKKLKIPFWIYSKQNYKLEKDYNEALLHKLKEFKIDVIALAGYMKIIHPLILKAYPNKIINIHPSLLPKFGGKGMYGDNVFKSILLKEEKESGVTVHFLNEKYDEGEIILQEKFLLDSNEDLLSLKSKTQKLEKIIYPKVLMNLKKLCFG